MESKTLKSKYITLYYYVKDCKTFGEVTFHNKKYYTDFEYEGLTLVWRWGNYIIKVFPDNIAYYFDKTQPKNQHDQWTSIHSFHVEE